MQTQIDDWDGIGRAVPPSGELFSLLMEALQHLAGLAQGLFGTMGCSHTRTAVAEGKCYCPDCGRGIVYQWVNLRCGGCRIRRESAYRLGRIIPADPFCRQCGESAVYAEYLENARPHQLHRAKLVMLVDSDYECFAERIRAWTQPSVSVVSGLLTA